MQPTLRHRSMCLSIVYRSKAGNGCRSQTPWPPFPKISLQYHENVKHLHSSPDHLGSRCRRFTSVSTERIPFFDLPISFANCPLPSPSDIESIRHALSLYPLSIDGKNFATLSNVFTADVVANYSAPINVL